MLAPDLSPPRDRYLRTINIEAAVNEAGARMNTEKLVGVLDQVCCQHLSFVCESHKASKSIGRG